MASPDKLESPPSSPFEELRRSVRSLIEAIEKGGSDLDGRVFGNTIIGRGEVIKGAIIGLSALSVFSYQFAIKIRQCDDPFSVALRRMKVRRASLEK